MAWLNRCRSLTKDWEILNRKALAFSRLASIRLIAAKTLQSRMMVADRLLRKKISDGAAITFLPWGQ